MHTYGVLCARCVAGVLDHRMLCANTDHCLLANQSASALCIAWTSLTARTYRAFNAENEPWKEEGVSMRLRASVHQCAHVCFACGVKSLVRAVLMCMRFCCMVGSGRLRSARVLLRSRAFAAIHLRGFARLLCAVFVREVAAALTAASHLNQVLRAHRLGPRIPRAPVRSERGPGFYMRTARGGSNRRAASRWTSSTRR